MPTIGVSRETRGGKSDIGMLPVPHAMPLMRRQKFLSMAGISSRRAGEILIRAGRVSVNGKTITAMGTRVDPLRDRVTVDGQRAEVAAPPIYVALNKPKGVVSSCRRMRDPIVLDFIPIKTRLYPVGRLDKESTGLLILTNDGDLHHRLLHPSFHHEKEYDVVTALPIPDTALATLAAGISLPEGTTRPARIKRVAPAHFRIVLREGKKRQIRRMVQKVGNRVVALTRIRFAGIAIKGLPEGKWRYLTQREIRLLKAIEGMSESRNPRGK